MAEWAGSALIAGGLLWVATYSVEVIIGVSLGEQSYLDADASASILEWLWPACFMAAIFFLGVGLLVVVAHLRLRGRVPGLVGGLLACVAIAASAFNMLTLVGVSGEPSASDGLGFAGVIGVLGGAVFVGVALLRAKLLRRWVRLGLTLLPLAFIPAIIATIPLASVAPEYVVADLPFPVVGLVMAMIGYAITRDRQVERN